MIAVMFELRVKDGKFQQYLDLAAALRPQLETLDGFISIERFASLSDEGKYLSLSLWRDESSVARWRANIDHRAAQATGRADLFEEYRLRVAEVVREYGAHDRRQAPPLAQIG